MQGIIVGGWGYVAAAWGISLGMLVAYSVYVNVRLARTDRDNHGRT